MLLLAALLGAVGLCVCLKFADNAEGDSLADLRADLRASKRAADKLLKNQDGTDRTPSEEELVRIEELHAECAAIQAKIEAMEEGMARIDAARAAAAKIDGDMKAVKAGAAPTDVSNTAATANVHENLRDDPTLGFTSIGEFAAGVHERSLLGSQAQRDERFEISAVMSQSVESDGGFLIPPEYSTNIWDEAQKSHDNLLQYASEWDISDGAESIEVPAIAETSRADGSRWGGVRGYWRGELGGAMTDSNPKLRSVKLEPHELYVFITATNKALRNASSIGQLINKCAPDEIMFKVNDAVMNGTGGDQPRGFLNGPATITVSKVDGQVADTIVNDNILDMHARMWAKWRSGAVWLINQDCEPSLDRMYLPTGTAGESTYMPSSGITENSPDRLKGKPVIRTEYNQTVGTEGDIVLWNGRTYAYTVKRGIERAVSMHLYFNTAQTAFRFMFEIDGAPILNSAITPKNGTNTYSGTITLESRD